VTDTATAPGVAFPEPGTPLVSAHDLHKAYAISRPPRDVLHGVSLEVARGQFVALMGPSGCGKSTLLHVLGGLEPPDAGTVLIGGQNLYALDDGSLAAYRRDHIGFVFQFFNLLPALTAAENIALPLRLRDDTGMFRPRRDRLGKRVILERVTALMEQLNLHGLQGHGPEEISGGEQQRVAIARALAAAPELLLADEPTGNLDWTTGHEVMALLARLCRSETVTTILVTHDARVAAYADRVMVMRDGEIIDEVALERQEAYGAYVPSIGPLIERLNQLHL
jgi:putative ABC transport system ATP-binding protein